MCCVVLCCVVLCCVALFTADPRLLTGPNWAGLWCIGIILALGASGSGFNSRRPPSFREFIQLNSTQLNSTQLASLPLGASASASGSGFNSRRPPLLSSVYNRIRLQRLPGKVLGGDTGIPRLRGIESAPFWHLESISSHPPRTSRASLPSLREFIGYMDRKTTSTQRQATTA